MTTSHLDPRLPASSGESLAPESPSPNRVDHGELLDHEYDGIKEYDNPMPRWWVLIFWGTFWFSLAYFAYFHVYGKGESVAAGYEREEVAAREQRLALAAKERVTEESLTRLLADQALVADAKLLYTERCALCHGADGQGQIGPNLTDSYWLHGKGTLLDIHRVITEGVTNKGMPSWQTQLTPIELRKLTAFVGSLRGRNLPGKAPEGQPNPP